MYKYRVYTHCTKGGDTKKKPQQQRIYAGHKGMKRHISVLLVARESLPASVYTHTYKSRLLQKRVYSIQHTHTVAAAYYDISAQLMGKAKKKPSCIVLEPCVFSVIIFSDGKKKVSHFRSY